jgi:purine catabolism regulator
MQLHDLLAEATNLEIRVANQQADLSRNVATIGMMEAPDISDFLVPGQLLVTTGYHFYKNVPSLLELVQNMYDKGCAAIGIKDHRYFEEIPAVVLNLADKLGFPVLLLPKDRALSAVVKELLHDVLESHSNELIEIIKYNNELSQLLLEDENTTQFFDRVSDILFTDCIFVDSHNEVVNANHAIWYQRAEITNEIQKNLDRARLVKHTEVLTMTYRDQPLLLSPIYATNKQTSGYFGVLGTFEETYGHTLFLQQVINLVGIANVRSTMKEETKHQLQTDFLNSILAGNLEEASIEANLDLQQLSPDNRYTCVVMEAVSATEASFIKRNTARIMEELAFWYIEDHKSDSLIFREGNQVIALVESRRNVKEDLIGLHTFLCDNFKEAYEFKMGYSHQMDRLVHLTTLHEEAVEAINLILTKSDQFMMEYRPKEVSELLHLVPENERVAFINKKLANLLDVKNKDKRQALLETLYVYFYHSRAVNKVAEALFTHRNTVIYRIKEIQQVLSVNFDDPVQRLDIMVAILLYHEQYN